MTRVKGKAAIAAEALKACDPLELGILHREILNLYHDRSISEVLRSIINVELAKYQSTDTLTKKELVKILNDRISLYES